MVENGEVSEFVVEELSRCGRNTGDIINTLEWFDQNEINVKVRNIGLESRPNGKKNPIWKMIMSVMSSLYEMELENIKERTSVGRIIYVRNGGKLGRRKGTEESSSTVLNKPLSQEILKHLQDGLSFRKTANIVGCSPTTVQKVYRVITKKSIAYPKLQ